MKAMESAVEDQEEPEAINMLIMFPLFTENPSHICVKLILEQHLW